MPIGAGFAIPVGPAPERRRRDGRAAVVPYPPRRPPAVPQRAQELDVADRVRALPEAVVLVDHQLAVYRHDGWWQCADTVRDVELLRSLWDRGTAPWRMWDDRRRARGLQAVPA